MDTCKRISLFIVLGMLVLNLTAQAKEQNPIPRDTSWQMHTGLVQLLKKLLKSGLKLHPWFMPVKTLLPYCL